MARVHLSSSYFMQLESRAEKGAPLATLQVLGHLESPHHPRAGGSESRLPAVGASTLPVSELPEGRRAF